MKSSKFPITVMVSLLMSMLPTGAILAEGEPIDYCYIPKESPLELTVEEGEIAYIYCESGVVTYSIEGTPIQRTHEDIGVMASGACVTESKAIDNIEAHKVMTSYTLVVPFSWNGSQVTFVGQEYGNTYALSTTGWYVIGQAQYPYSDPIPGPVRGTEGWANFNGGLWTTNYPHEHRAIQHVTYFGGCAATDYFSGYLPTWSYRTFQSYIGT